MSYLRDPGVGCSERHRNDKDSLACSGPSVSSRLGSSSNLLLSSIIINPLGWVEDSFNAYRDGLSKEERKDRMDRENRKQVIYLKMRNAMSYDEWRDCAYELDELEDHNAWKKTFECSDYNPDQVQERLNQLEDARISCDVGRMLFLIRTSLNRDLGGMSNASLYRHSHVGTKDLIDRYITTTVDTIDALVNLSEQNRDEAELKYILDQLLATRQAFGRSALLFSGGATFGMNHIGVLKVLWEKNLLPRIISGASAGSIICAVFCTRTDDELPILLDTYAYGDFNVFNEQANEENILQKTARFLKYGSFLDISHLAKVMRNWLGDITFQEAYNRTRRILNICVSSAGVYELPRLMNYLTAPNVLIWSAVAVSCSVPLVFRPFVLMAKDPITEEPVPWNDLHKQYIDGSVDGDLPMTRLSETFNVNHFIVSQVNPHVVPFLPKDEGPNDYTGPDSKSSPGWLHTITNLAKEEVLHRMAVLSDLGVFPTSLTKIASIMNQKYFGDITIYPEIQYSDIRRALTNPTTEFMLQSCINGERAAWPKMGRVRNHVAIELALDSAVQKMRARVALSNNPLDMRKLTRHSTDPFDSSGDHGNVHHHPRRNSFSHEVEPTKRVRCNSSSRRLKRSQSVVSFEQPVRARTTHSESAIQDWDDIHETTLARSGDGPSISRTSSRRPNPPSRRASWGALSGTASVSSSQHIRPRSRRSSSSSSSWQSVHSDEPTSSQAHSWPNPMSPLRGLLKMTPKTSDGYFDSLR
ncbi:putative Patatin family phospholipase [Aspergillus glaucus CBS 516.65]|uniref:Patatin-like phospholipase domain-containing protein n=1 Tax=Aspergillus glaucus CBS 516.65 TaxID=1160497 RepID=A0A1L9VZB9_ASPGL|nr:hypothetical protein ASPGLDRAFT_21393 [Aspergillus glaucus CBS 516.65]OJJ89255.1 hypothetical protein ASPGLDRAFT_21393 [Aspergillus glaucus CBS 516.65]